MSLILSGTDGLSDVDGSASTPAIRGTDANTGIFFPAADTIAFSEGGTEVVRIDSSGNVGIGTTTPTGKFEVRSANNTGTDSIIRATSNNGTASTWLTFNGVSVSSGNTFVFYNGTTEHMRIDSSGNVGVGTTTPATPNNGGICFNPSATSSSIQVAGSSTSNGNNGFLLYSTGSSSYKFYVGYGGTISAVSTSISSLSDQSLKENIVDLPTGLTQVMALKPRKFDWKDGEGTNEKNVDGFIAQELQKVMPKLVTQYQYNAEETKLGIKMGDLIPTLVKAIQELNAKVEAQAVRIAELEGAR
jgi:hypothetical protein